MVKPQFEVGKDRVGKGGVVREPELRAEAVAGGGRGRGPAGLGRAGGDRQPAAGSVGQRGVLPVAAPRPGHASAPRTSAADGAGAPTPGVPGEKVEP